MKFWISLFFLFFSFLTVIGRNNEKEHLINSFCPNEKSSSTEITCIQTNTNGNVTLFWSQAADPTNSFIEYQLHSVQNGLITSVNSIGITFYTQTGVNQKLDYFITTVYGIGGNETSQTISNIFLSLNNPSDGTAVLQWNNPTATQLPGMESYTKIYREFPTGTWTLRDSVPFGAVFYKDTIDICQAFLNYKVVIKSLACDFISNILGDNLKDIITPEIPIINKISIDTLTSNVTINWNINNQPDTKGYIIYQLDDNGVPFELATVLGRFNTTYNHSTTSMNLKSLSFSIAAFDSCFTTSPTPTHQTSAKAEIHTSINTKFSYNVCDRDIRLYWTPYKGWKEVSEYEVWGHILGQKWIKFGTTNELQYHITAEALKNYCFAIKAVSTEGIESFSNLVCLKSQSPSQATFNYLKTATIQNEKVLLNYYIEAKTGVKEIQFQRLNSKNIFETIGTLPVSNSELIFIDENVTPSKLSYTYRGIIIDSCGNFGAISNESKTILLTVQTDEVNTKHYLNWTKYEGFNGSILGYKIFRGFDGYMSPEYLAIVSSNQIFYEDILIKNDYTGRTCYYVQAIEGLNIYNFKDSSLSNTICPIIKPIIYIPNSFTPNSDKINENFKPQFTYVELSNYEFTVFDRWEHVLFKTSKIDEGWNGEINKTGKIAEPGTYVYLIIVKDGNGVETIQRGHINLLK